MFKLLTTIIFKTLIITYNAIQIAYWLSYLLYQKYQERKMVLAEVQEEAWDPFLE